MLIIEPCAGLGNRILALATAYQLAKDTGHQMTLLWDVDGAVGISAEELFELPADMHVIRTTKLPYREKPILRLKSELLRCIYRHQADIFLDCSDIEAIKKNIEEITVREYLAENSRVYIKSFCELENIVDNHIFTILKPSVKICNRGTEVFSKITDRTAGIHIRRTDHAEAIKNSPVHLFIDTIQMLIASGNADSFFLATDDEAVETQLRNLFGDRIITHRDKKFSRSDRQGMLDAYIDMLALSKCNCIYGSFGSTFSRIAAYLGDKELVILQGKAG